MKQLIRHILREHMREIGENKKLTTPEFVEKAIAVHGDKYDYSKVDYMGADKKVEIICPTHKISFFQEPRAHINMKQGCPLCGGETRADKRRDTVDNFIERAKKVHKNNYGYDKVIYKNLMSDVIIKCPKHGYFPQRAGHHLNGSGCPECYEERKGDTLRSTNDEFIKKSNIIHKNKYGYSEVIYKNSHTPVRIECKKHGIFLQKPSEHLSGSGCPFCSESKGENLVDEILKKKKIKFEREKRFLDCTNISKTGRCSTLPFDFYISSKNIAIEYDGAQHYFPIKGWGGDENFKNIQKRDKIKNKYCKKNGIKLIRIPYTMKKEEIEPYILKELGIK